MAFFDKVFKQLFPEKQTAMPKSVPLVSEKLERKSHERSHYFKWMNEALYKSEASAFISAYDKKRENIQSKLPVHILSTKYANGFALSFAPPFNSLHFQHFFDYLKDKTLDLGYILNIADRKMFDRGSYIETIEKYYLKPPIATLEANQLFDQKWGNVLIEQALIDDKPSYIKFMANIYSDRLYTVALPFDELMDAIFRR